MANEIANATAWTLCSQGMLVHAAGSEDRTRPSAPTIGTSAQTDTTITITHTAPDDADYSTTEAWAFALDGGDDGTASGAGSTITIEDLSAANNYIIAACAKDTAGNRSAIVVLTTVVRTQAASSITYPLNLYFYTDRRTTALGHCPVAVDPTVTGRRGVHKKRINGRGRVLRIRGVCRAPVLVKLIEIGAQAILAPRAPHGLREV